MNFDLKEFTHRINLVLTLFTKMKYRYRVEVEDYFHETWVSTLMNYYHFNYFDEAQKFIRGYKKPYYIIRLFEQEKGGFQLCNIDTGQLATQQDERGIDYRIDKYGYSIPVELSAGWYLRGMRLHHPIFVEVQDDVVYLKRETLRRFIDANAAVSIESLVRGLFRERHPDAPAYFQTNLCNMVKTDLNKAARKRGASEPFK